MILLLWLIEAKLPIATEMSKFTKAKKNKEKNLRKKKKEKSKRRRNESDINSESDSAAPSTKTSEQKSMSSVSREFMKLKATATPQAIVRAKLKRDQRLLERDMKDLCKNVTKLFKTMPDDEKEHEEEEHIAEVETLSKNVGDLIISNDNPEPGFHYTRWQQRKFLQKVPDKKIKYNNGGDKKK